MNNNKQDQDEGDSSLWSSSQKIVDHCGNIECGVCGNIQSPVFTACIECCPHNDFEFFEEWYEHSSDSGEWRLMPVCKKCGKDFDMEALAPKYLR